MISVELLALIGAGAVLPYVVEGACDWYSRHRRKASDGADAPD